MSHLSRLLTDELSFYTTTFLFAVTVVQSAQFRVTVILFT